MMPRQTITHLLLSRRYHELLAAGEPASFRLPGLTMEQMADVLDAWDDSQERIARLEKENASLKLRLGIGRYAVGDRVIVPIPYGGQEWTVVYLFEDEPSARLQLDTGATCVVALTQLFKV